MGVDQVCRKDGGKEFSQFSLFHLASAAEHAGKSTHSFIVEAIAENADMEEQRVGFGSEANARFAKIVESGKTIPWADLRHYLEARLDGKQVSRPVAKVKRE